MLPYIYQSNSVTIGSYGVMLAIAYLTGRHLFISRVNENTNKPVNTEILIILLLIGGVIGAKLMFTLKNPDKSTLSDLSSLMSGSGFSSQGAIIAAIIITVVFAKVNKLKLDQLLDSAAFPAIIAYALARIGCFLAGDDCYGIPTDLPWGMAFENGVAPTLEIVHPVPIYEIIYSIAIALILKHLESKTRQPYRLFFILLLTWGACRFLVEFVSSNPIKLVGMSGSQFGALIMLLAANAFFAQQYFSTSTKKPG